MTRWISRLAVPDSALVCDLPPATEELERLLTILEEYQDSPR